jgi:riboflavin kinase/FMN adenylyltransferase
MTVIEGIVEHGDQRGRLLGFPTANITVSDEEIADGVWGALVKIQTDRWAAAAVSVGRRRTFYGEEGPKLLEAHLLNHNEDLYGRKIRVELLVKLRPQQTFPDIQSLTDQLHQDVQKARDWAATHYPGLIAAKGVNMSAMGTSMPNMSYA